ncbi:MAG: hypothetical protein U1D67_02685 [Dehalococcoidia bacterium]|nr:hypothetical protein [Dehalococcoidia bacterium]
MHPMTREVAAIGISRLIDIGVNKVINNGPGGPTKDEQINRTIERIDSLIKSQSAAPAAYKHSPAGPEPVTGREAVSVGCVPCARAHFSTVSGTLKEALRFAREGGIMHPEVQSRLLTAEEDITNVERHDWTPEKIINSPVAEQEIVRKILPILRELRQDMMEIASVEQLEAAAANAGELSTLLRLEVLKMRGVDTDRIVDLAHKVQSGDMSMEDAREELGG